MKSQAAPWIVESVSVRAFIAVKRHHDNSYEENIFGGSLTVLEVSVHCHHDREHGSKHADVVLEE